MFFPQIFYRRFTLTNAIQYTFTTLFHFPNPLTTCNFKRFAFALYRYDLNVSNQLFSHLKGERLYFVFRKLPTPVTTSTGRPTPGCSQTRCRQNRHRNIAFRSKQDGKSCWNVQEPGTELCLFPKTGVRT